MHAMISETHIRRRLAAGAVATALAALLAGPALARSWSMTGQDGRSYSRTVTPYNKGGGNLGRTVTTFRPDGQTATNSFSRSVSNGTITENHTATGFAGSSASTTTTRTPGQGGTVSYRGPGGGTYSGSYTNY